MQKRLLGEYLTAKNSHFSLHVFRNKYGVSHAEHPFNSVISFTLAVLQEVQTEAQQVLLPAPLLQAAEELPEPDKQA